MHPNTAPRLFALLLATLWMAAPVPATAKGLMDVYTLAKQHDADIQIAESRYRAEIQKKPIARANFLPQVGLEANTTDVRQETRGQTFGVPGRTVNFNSHGYGLNLSQALYHRDFYVQFRQAQNSADKARVDLDAAHQSLIVRTAGAYFNVLAAQDAVTFQEAEKKAIGRQLKQARQHFDVGIIAITDVHEAQASYDLAVVKEIEALNALEISKAALEVIVAQRLDNLFPLSNRMELVAPTPDNTEDWVAKGLQQNLALLSSEHASKIARQEIKLQQSRHHPTLDLVGSYSHLDTSGISGPREMEDTQLGLEFSMPIFQGGKTHYGTKQARHNAARAQNEYEKVQRQTIQDVRDAYLNVISGISRVEALATAVESNESAARAAEAGFQAGTRTSVDVLLAVQETFRAKRDHARARYDYLLHTLKLKQATGTLSVDDLLKIDDWLD